MSRERRIDALVLAAGKSSRMGKNKLLLPLGSVTAIERTIGSICGLGLGDTVVVTGHQANEIAPVLDRLAVPGGPPVRRVHNAGYEAGMFSSIKTGVAALRSDSDGFFVLPADYALIRPEVLWRLLRSFRADDRRILHPTCCGLRGHPPLISNNHRDALLQASTADSLRDFSRRCAADEAEVEVEDLTILMDMDKSEDYRVMSRFADLMDAAERATKDRSPSLRPEEACYLLSQLEVPDQVVRHSRAVASVGAALAEALTPRVPNLRVDLVQAACLLHDMARAQPRHAIVAQTLLSNLGLARLGSIVGAHMVLPPEQLEATEVTEEQLVYLADKLVVGDKLAGLEARERQTLQKHRQDAAAQQGIRARTRAAQTIADKVESVLRRPLGEFLP